MTRPPVHRGMLITPEILLQLGACAGHGAYKRFSEHIAVYHKQRGGHILDLEHLRWAKDEGYDLQALSSLLFQKGEFGYGGCTVKTIWAALPEAPAGEIPPLVNIDEVFTQGHYRAAEAGSVQKAVDHFAARCDAMEEQAEDAGVHAMGIRESQRRRIEKLEGSLETANSRIGDEQCQRGKLKECIEGHEHSDIRDLIRRVKDYLPPKVVGQVETEKHDPKGVLLTGITANDALKGKWFLYGEGKFGRPKQITHSGNGRIHFNLSTGPDWVLASFVTILDGTDRDCELEVGDEVCGGMQDVWDWRVLAIQGDDMVLEAIDCKKNQAQFFVAPISDYRKLLRLVNRPPKGEGK